MSFYILKIITLLGGLALFLFGMDIMGNSLEKLAGGKLSFAACWFLEEYLRRRRLESGYSVYVVPFKGDQAYDDQPIPPDLEAFIDSISESSSNAEDIPVDTTISTTDENQETTTETSENIE